MATFTCSYKIQADQENNRLYLIIKGFLIDEYVKRTVKKITQEVNKLKKGFEIIGDVSELNPATEKDAGKIEKACRYAIDKKPSKIIQVINNKGKGEFVSSGTSNQTIKVKSLEEAELLLQC